MHHILHYPFISQLPCTTCKMCIQLPNIKHELLKTTTSIQFNNEYKAPMKLTNKMQLYKLIYYS